MCIRDRDNAGKKWMEAEYMDGTSLENRYGKGE
jgi:hypothetical protein